MSSPPAAILTLGQIQIFRPSLRDRRGPPRERTSSAATQSIETRRRPEMAAIAAPFWSRINGQSRPQETSSFSPQTIYVLGLVETCGSRRGLGAGNRSSDDDLRPQAMHSSHARFSSRRQTNSCRHHRRDRSGMRNLIPLTLASACHVTDRSATHSVPEGQDATMPIAAARSLRDESRRPWL
jgi:hypothetical protein